MWSGTETVDIHGGHNLLGSRNVSPLGIAAQWLVHYAGKLAVPSSNPVKVAKFR